MATTSALALWIVQHVQKIQCIRAPQEKQFAFANEELSLMSISLCIAIVGAIGELARTLFALYCSDFLSWV